ncbi:MAG: glycosyltransferase family 9 protein, partial [Pyrinomonadaceae bacterium]
MKSQLKVVEPRPLGSARWDWSNVKKILVIRLRSIGDTVLSTPSIYALRRFLPGARIDVVLEDWVASVLEDSPDVDQIITFKRGSLLAKIDLVQRLRREKYDVAFNIHGGSTASFMTGLSGARHRVGYQSYRYYPLHNHLAPASSTLWGRDKTHSTEQQLALPGWCGVPVSDRPPARLGVSPLDAEKIDHRLREYGLQNKPFALVHPTASFDSKQWATVNFARSCEYINSTGLAIVAVTAPDETSVMKDLLAQSKVSIAGFSDLTLGEVKAIGARARLFLGNDSSIAHICAAFAVPSVVIFGSSNVAHWRPWTDAPHAVVREEMPCAPCPGYRCSEYPEAQCIRRVRVEQV